MRISLPFRSFKITFINKGLEPHFCLLYEVPALLGYFHYFLQGSSWAQLWVHYERNLFVQKYILHSAIIRRIKSYCCLFPDYDPAVEDNVGSADAEGEDGEGSAPGHHEGCPGWPQ